MLDNETAPRPEFSYDNAPGTEGERKMRPLELWGGVECTVNRIGDRYFDQLALTGHADRMDDLDRIADLGFSAIRFPILWERVSPDTPDAADWAWSDARLDHLVRRGVRPIVGLVHHGSGPRYTSLLDEGFAAGLARHAEATARRYPWVQDWTPVNEPLTTARFSALYGFWYPHVRDEQSFWLALLNQVDGVRLSMQAIRRINPAARLIQTDDLGRTYATAELADQAGFDNARRWMTWDLLTGRVVPGHPLWARLSTFGFSNRLRAMAADPCPPDVIGINHYLTSDRFLDHRLQRYPAEVSGGNTQRPYADVEAIRVLDPPPQGLGGALREAWARYGIPVAVTEVHNGCTREEQLRWLRHARDSVEEVRREGADIIALTAWALLGNQGWNTLLRGDGIYEPGVFDISGGSPRATALVSALGGRTHPVGDAPGWWQREARLLHPGVSRAAPWKDRPAAPGLARPLLIAGKTGTLGQAFAAACRVRGLAVELTSRAELDLHDPGSVTRLLEETRPWAVINAAGWVRVDDAEDEADACHRVNATGAAALAHAAEELGIPTVNFSSDLVFDGTATQPYTESCPPAPLNVYGRSKAELEAAVAVLAGQHLTVRTAAFFSHADRHNFAVATVAALREGREFLAARDCIISPTYVPHLCNAVLDLLIDGEAGIVHLTNGDDLSWAEFAQRIASVCGLRRELVRPVDSAELGWRAARPGYVPLKSERTGIMPSLDVGIESFARHIGQG